MPVYLVHREAYQENCKALKKFPMSNLLEWAQYFWGTKGNNQPKLKKQ
jgi:hypothetical protein